MVVQPIILSLFVFELSILWYEIRIEIGFERLFLPSASSFFRDFEDGFYTALGAPSRDFESMYQSIVELDILQVSSFRTLSFGRSIQFYRISRLRQDRLAHHRKSRPVGVETATLPERLPITLS